MLDVKRSEILFGVLLVPLDFALLIAAGLAAYGLRITPWVQKLRPALFLPDLPLEEYVGLVVVVSLFVQGVFALLGLYAMRTTRRMFDEFVRVAAGVTIGIMGVIIAIFLRAELFQSRFLVIGAWFLGIVFVVAGRYIARRVQLALLKRGIGAYRTILVGSSPVARNLREIFENDTGLGNKVVGHLLKVDRGELEELHRRHSIEEIIVCDPELPEKESLTLLDFCEEHKIDYRYVPNLYGTVITNVRVNTIHEIPVVELVRTRLDGWGRVVKRLMDIVGALVGLVIFAPLFLYIALRIKDDSPGPIFFRQTRLGRNKKPFTILKFRSMVADAEKLKPLLKKMNEREGPLFKIRNDPRITPFGRVLRRRRWDELPQLINVLRGEMSLVGPRPHLPEEAERYAKHHRKLFTIKPGITGLAQISGASDLSFEEEAKLDIHYIENWSLKMDFQILLKTVRIFLTPDRSAV